MFETCDLSQRLLFQLALFDPPPLQNGLLHAFEGAGGRRNARGSFLEKNNLLQLGCWRAALGVSMITKAPVNLTLSLTHVHSTRPYSLPPPHPPYQTLQAASITALLKPAAAAPALHSQKKKPHNWIEEFMVFPSS